MSSASKKQGTRVFKKGSPNGKITVYLGKRDFVDHVTHVDPIDGVVLVDPDYLKDRKVYGHVLAAFRYGREDLDVLGLTFRKDLYLASSQIFPVPEDSETTKRPLTRLQERLVKKLGANAYPFFFELPPHCPASVTLQVTLGAMITRIMMMVTTMMRMVMALVRSRPRGTRASPVASTMR